MATQTQAVVLAMMLRESFLMGEREKVEGQVLSGTDTSLAVSSSLPAFTNMSLHDINCCKIRGC
jgi:hypothetical protein